MASSVCCLLRRNLSRFAAPPYPEIRTQFATVASAKLRSSTATSGAKSCGSEACDSEVEIGRLAVGEVPGSRQAGEGQGPFEQPMPVERGGIGQYVDLTVEAPWRQRRRGVGIAQDVDDCEMPILSVSQQHCLPLNSTMM
jgi:hypothetical protein